jgi:3-hydroxybutyryl-CoA dehydratase
MIEQFREGDKFLEHFMVTEIIYTSFIHLFNDRNPLHTDSSFAKNKGFTDTVMHGNILCGFVSYFIGECLPIKDVIIHSQSIQYKNPVYRDEALDFEAIVAGIYESVGAVEFSFTFRKANSRQMVAKGKIQIGII